MIRDTELSIPAGQAVTVGMVGQFVGLLNVSNNTAEIQVTGYKQDGERILEARMLEGERVTLDREFTQLRFENTAGADLTVTALIGRGRFESGRLVGEVTTTQPTTLTANTALVVAATPVVQTIAANSSRKNIMLQAPITNTSPFWIGGTVGEGVPVMPGQSVVLDGTFAVDLIGETTGDILYSIEQRA